MGRIEHRIAILIMLYISTCVVYLCLTGIRWIYHMFTSHDIGHNQRMMMHILTIHREPDTVTL